MSQARVFAEPGGRGSRSSTLSLIDVDHLEDRVATLRNGARCALIEVEPLNLLLRSEADRELVGRRYRQLLASLPGPISLYSLSQPARLDRGVEPAPGGSELEQAEARFRRELIHGHLIQEQRHLLLVAGGTSPAAALRARLSTPTRPPASASGVDLGHRVDSLMAALGRVGLRCSRVDEGGWLHLLQQLGGGQSGRQPANFTSWMAPGTAAVTPRSLRVGDTVSRSLCLGGYPRRVGLGWLAPLLRGSECQLRLAQHVVPLPKLMTLTRLRRKIRSFETSLLVDQFRGRRGDRGTETALGDALSLEEQVLLEQERLFQLEICITLTAGSDGALDEGWQQLLTTLAEVGCSPVPLTHRQADGWRATMPWGTSPLGWWRDITASALAMAFPFVRTSLVASTGILLGPSSISRELVVIDPFAPSNPNFNVLVLGTSGAGKSYTAKLLAARLALQGCRLRCIDPMGEYRSLAELLQGQFIEMGPGAAGLPLLGAPVAGAGPEDPAVSAAARAMVVLELLLGGSQRRSQLDPQAVQALEGALVELHRSQEGPPTLMALGERLRAAARPDLAERLARFTTGLLAGTFDGTVTDGSQRLQVLSLTRLAGDRDQLLPAFMQLVLQTLEREMLADPRVPRLVVVDEAEVLLSRPRSAEALESLSRRVRKLGSGLLVISQVVEDFLGSAVGNVVVRNCHTKLLLRQEEVAIPAVRRAFGLSEVECDLLRDARAGAGVAMVGRERAAFQGLAPQELHPALITDARPATVGG